MKSEPKILSFKKETINKWRWFDKLEDAVFHLYIYKWRTPKPMPDKIKVTIGNLTDISSATKKYTKKDFKDNPGLRKKSIYAELGIPRKHTQTMRYKPINDKDHWGIGNTYIPFQLLPEKKDRIAIFIEWH